MLELYHWEPNTYFLKPLVALHEKQQAFTSRWFDAARLEQLDPRFPASPEIRLSLEREGPVLVHEGALITGSFFLLEYIAEALPGVPLHGQDAWEQYRVRSFGQVLGAMGADVSLLGCARYLAPRLRQEDPAIRARIAGLQPLERRAAWSAWLEERADNLGLAQARDRLRFQVARLEKALSPGPWLIGARHTLADIDAFALTRCLPQLAPDIVNDKTTPQLMDFLARMHARPAVQAALAMSRSGHPEEAFVPGAEPSRWG